MPLTRSTGTCHDAVDPFVHAGLPERSPDEETTAKVLLFRTTNSACNVCPAFASASFADNARPHFDQPGHDRGGVGGHPVPLPGAEPAKDGTNMTTVLAEKVRSGGWSGVPQGGQVGIVEAHGGQCLMKTGV